MHENEHWPLLPATPNSPHVLLKPRFFPDGDQWCFLYGKNLMEGIVGFGPTPAVAASEFDRAWRDSLTPDAVLAARTIRPEEQDDAEAEVSEAVA